MMSYDERGNIFKPSCVSAFEQCNKYFHIWAGRFAYLAGVVQCYRGLELVSGDDNLLFSAGDGLDLEVHQQPAVSIEG